MTNYQSRGKAKRAETENETPFQQIKGKRRSTYVIEQLTDLILEGHYSRGDKLPPERVISRDIGVSRTAVREAFGILNSMGIITRRQGDGTYVQSSDEEVLSQTLSLQTKEKKLWHVFQLQSILEPAVASLAVEEANGQDIEDLKEALKEMDKAVETEDLELYFSADREFHLAIAWSTGNPLVLEQVKVLLEYMNDELWKSFKARNLEFNRENIYFCNSLETHQTIVESIEKGDSNRLARTMEEHFDRVGEKLF